ncbi:MAG: S46 family peptidase [Gemmatimonadota bacterium]|nr:S46 family peptidase [Gemmatimonadota bacterium]
MRHGLTAFLMLALATCATPASPPTPPPPAPADQDPVQPAAEAPAPADAPAQPVPPQPPSAPSRIDTVQAGAFDNGKMWTFDAPPTRYLRDTYGFSPDDDWYARARLGALRIPNCSASLVSPNGLVMTNHHCAREFVTQVSEEGENLLDDGFYAATLADERGVEDFEADQLIEIVDVTSEIRDAVDAAPDSEARAAMRDSLTESVADRLQAERGGEEAGVEVEVVSLYNGGLYSAYIFRRYTNAALVMAPELGLGFFGGEPDNFTYPRYALDMAFLRLLDEDGQPLATGDHFRWDDEGVAEGDLIFIIGNPGSTSRLQTVAELEYRRDVEMPALLGFLGSRIDVFDDYIEGREDEPGIDDVRNELFSLLNSQKAFTGMLGGLRDPYIMARRGAAQAAFVSEIEGDPGLRADYLPLFDEMAELQARKASVADETHAFAALGSPDFEAALILRTLAAFQHLVGQQTGATQEELDGFVEEMRGVPNRPAELDEALLRARIEDLAAAFGEDDPSVGAILQGRSAGEVASSLMASSIMADSAGAVDALVEGTLAPGPAFGFLQTLFQRFGPYQEVMFGTGPQEEEIAARLGRARFEVSGTDVPPDATFSLRLADGVVQGFPYNGTVAPPVTTFFGLYDRHHSNPGSEEWALPGRWLDPPESFDLSTPLNFVSTADIIGGNSGSPVVNRELEIVGVVFDGNIQSLPGDYIYIPDENRSVAVDARGILEALDEIYGAGRIVEELTSRR